MVFRIRVFGISLSRELLQLEFPFSSLLLADVCDHFPILVLVGAIFQADCVTFFLAELYHLKSQPSTTESDLPFFYRKY